jgi:predicted Zn-ribbon and HTH transcriptional regulator
MATCRRHGYYADYDAVGSMCPKCVRDEIAERSDRMSGKNPIGHCNEHGYYYAKYKGIYDGCPVCARERYG